MRSVVYERFGVPEQVLQVAERPRPEPSPGQALVRLVLSPIHNHDLMTAAGQYGFKPELPAAGGTEAVGVVEALGEGVDNLKVGQRVAGGAQATWAEYYLVDASRALPVPDGVDDATACQLVSMPLSAKMILHTLGLKRGDWLVQNAANGAVGKLIAQFGGEAGINVLGLVRRDEAVDELRALGIERVVSTGSEGWQERARAVVGDARVGRGIDSLGGDGPGHLAEVMADGGTITNFGAMTGRPLRITPALLLFRGITVNGFWGAKPNVPPAEIGRMLGELVAEAASGRLRLTVDRSFTLDDVAAAVAAHNAPGRSGKIALRP